MSAERALLRRLVASDDAIRDGTHMEHLMPHFEEQKAILADARAALLAALTGEGK